VAAPTVYTGGHFRVEIDGIARADFHSVSGLAGLAQVQDSREGGDPDHPVHEIGAIGFENIILSAGLNGDRELFDWWRTAADPGPPATRGMSVVLLNRANQEMARWDVMNALPVRYSVSALDVGDTDIVLETLELAHEGFVRA
jgi:phage tail-like protein